MGRIFSGREVRSDTSWAGVPPVPPLPGVNFYGQSVADDPDSALANDTVWACVQLLANSVSMLPLETYRRTSDVPAKISSPAVVASPDAGMTQSQWLHMFVVSLMLRGNVYALESGQYHGGYPTSLTILNPDNVQVKTDPDTGDATYLVGPNKVDRTADMFHVPWITLPGSRQGLSPIAYAAATIDVDSGARRFAQSFFDGGGLPKAVLTSDMNITQDQARVMKDRLMAATNNREPIALGSGVQYQQIGIKPEESQFLATMKANTGRIARFFGIPAEMIGGESGSSLTYANVEQRSLDFLTFGLGPVLKRIEDAFFPILPQPVYVAFDRSQLLAQDAETQAKVRVTYVAGKVLPPSRVLQDMNEKPLTDAEKAELELVPLTVTPTGMPKALPNPGNPATSDDTPVVGKPPATQGEPNG